MKNIPVNLQTSLTSHATTLCFLLLITPQHAPSFGLTSLDVDIDYDDGDGSVTYQAIPGANVSSVETSAGLDVENAEVMVLVDTDFTRQDVAAGILDYADFVLYRMDYLNPSDGHIIIETGRTGVVTSSDTLSGIIELRGISQQLKQNFIDLYSLSCRASFGSTSSDEMFPCNYDATVHWQTTTISAVGTEADRRFTSTDIPAATGPNGILSFDVAIIEFLTGDNTGLTVETETVIDDEIELRFASAYPMQVGDSFKIRPDCAKRFRDDCVATYDNGSNFRGEPYIPLTEENPSQNPGAQIPGWGAPSSMK